jgi:putative endonuclease
MTFIEWLRLIFPRKYKELPQNLREGRIGEDAAARYLLRHGYRIAERNFVSGKNEIDIIAKKKKLYVFCEVKTRVQDYGEDAAFGRPASAVDEHKRRNLCAAATTFERRHAREGCSYRFDVLEVYLSPECRVTHVHHIEGAFMREKPSRK